MTATLALAQSPTAVDIDRLAVKFLELERKTDDAYRIAVALDEPHERMKGELICLVDEFGSAHAEKSKLLKGIEYQIMGTFGTSTSMDNAVVQRFAHALAAANQQRLMSKILSRRLVTHSLPRRPA